MRASTESIRRLMRTLGSATCPELAVAAGLSLVTVHKEVRRLCERGELREGARRVSRGGRPSPVYEYEARYARRILIEITRRGAVMHGALELADMQGNTLRRRESTYAALEEESLDGLVDEMLGRQRLASIALFFQPAETREEMRAHLQRRYGCPVACVSVSEALAEAREGTATLYLSQGEAPQCTLYRHGQMMSSGRLELLPMPAAWESLDYTDHTLVEEMVARLLQVIACTLTPERVALHAGFWSKRLVERIRFNAQSKLKGNAPALVFRGCTAQAARDAVRAYAWGI